jgi:hypothetical protein
MAISGPMPAGSPVVMASTGRGLFVSAMGEPYFCSSRNST